MRLRSCSGVNLRDSSQKNREIFGADNFESGKVTLELHGKDTYGRHLAYVFDSNGTFVERGNREARLSARPLTLRGNISLHRRLEMPIERLSVTEEESSLTVR